MMQSSILLQAVLMVVTLSSVTAARMWPVSLPREGILGDEKEVRPGQHAWNEHKSLRKLPETDQQKGWAWQGKDLEHAPVPAHHKVAAAAADAVSDADVE